MRDMPRLSRRLTLEAAHRVSDGGGGWAVEWRPLGTLWGEIRPASARDDTVGARPTSRVTHRITVRLSPAPAARPKPDQRLRAGGRVFAIRGVAESDARCAHLTVWVEEGPFS